MRKEIKMRFSTHKVLYVLTIAALASGCSQQVSYEKDVSPILRDSCLVCHAGSGEGVAASGFSVRTYDDLMKGTKFGAVVIPGDSVSSTLYRLIDHKADPKIQMPPHHSDTVASEKMTQLTEKQISTIKTWIDQGAKNN